MTDSILQQLLALYFAIIYSLQLGSGEKKKKKKNTNKNSSIYFTDFTDLDFFYTNIYF